MPSTSKILTLSQFRETKQRNRGRRFTLKEKIVALSILKHSPKGYRFLSKIFILPSRQTLLKLLNMADINPGINKNIIQQIRKATENMKLEHKICVILFDEMSLKPNVTYNEKKDSKWFCHKWSRHISWICWSCTGIHDERFSKKNISNLLHTPFRNLPQRGLNLQNN